MELERRLYRSRHDRLIAGVCGGIANYFELDPKLVRLVAVVSIFLQGAGLLIYLIAWIVLPEPPQDAEVHLPRQRGPRAPRRPPLGRQRPSGADRSGKPRPPIQFPGHRRQQDDESKPAGDEDAPDPDSSHEDRGNP